MQPCETRWNLTEQPFWWFKIGKIDQIGADCGGDDLIKLRESDKLEIDQSLSDTLTVRVHLLNEFISLAGIHDSLFDKKIDYLLCVHEGGKN